MQKIKRYNDYSTYLKLHFPHKMQKITIHAGFSCPNRDGKVGYGGCTYCNNQTFNPEYLYIPVVIKCLVKEPSETNFFSG